MKSTEDELKRKSEYYQKNKEKILARKRERKDIIYENKMNRKIESDDEYEKEQMRRLSKVYEAEKPDKCEMCSISSKEIDHELEKHHPFYDSAEIWWLCKPCHSECDRCRRRKS